MLTASIIAAFHLGLNQPVTKALKVTEYRQASDGIVVNAFPNPTTQYFTIQTRSNNKTPINVCITDATARIVDAFQGLPANGSIQFGAHYVPDVYFAELIRGSWKKTIKLIKSTH